MLPQYLHSVYTFLFMLPLLPRLLVRHAQGVARRVFTRLDPSAALLPWGREVASNSIPAIHVYAANLGQVRRPKPWRSSTPTLVVVARGDGFVSPRSLAHLDARCRDLTRVELDCGHWVPRAEPVRLAGLLRDFVTGVEERTA